MSLTARDFPPGTPLHHFFAWNEAVPAWRRDRRYRLARTPGRLAGAGRAGASSRDRQRRSRGACGGVRRFRALRRGSRRGRQRILVIRLSALGDFIQALGPIAAIRHHHADDHVSLLTTRPLAGFAEELGYFDEVIVDERPGVLALRGWLRLRRRLRQGRFDRVYDLQTSTRSAAYAWLLRPGMPEWSGIAWRCSHPHANRDRDPQHTLDKQAEQLLMAGIYPTPLPMLPPLRRDLPCGLRGPGFRAARAGIVADPSRKALARRTLRRSGAGARPGRLSCRDCRDRGGSAARGAHSRDLPGRPRSDRANRSRSARRARAARGADGRQRYRRLPPRRRGRLPGDRAVFRRHRSGALRPARPARQGDRRGRFARSGGEHGHRRLRRHSQRHAPG